MIRLTMTIRDLRAIMEPLPDDMPIAVRGYKTGFDRLTSAEVFTAPLSPYVGPTVIGVVGPHWFDGDLDHADDGTSHL